MLKTIHAILALSVITLTGFATLPAFAEPLKVVASFSIIGDFAKNVGGNRVEITTLVGPDGDAHVYEPKPADAVAMAKADVVLVNGLNFEGFLQRLVDASATRAAVGRAGPPRGGSRRGGRSRRSTARARRRGRRRRRPRA